MNKFRHHAYFLYSSYFSICKEFISLYIFGAIFISEYIKQYLIFCLILSGVRAIYKTIQYRKETYEITDDVLEISKGVLTRQTIKLPYSIIQTADVTQTFWQRLFRVSQLTIDTGTMQDTEGLKVYLKKDQAKNIRMLILSAMKSDEDDAKLSDVADEVKSQKTYFYELNFKQLFVYCFSKSSLIMTIIYVIGFCFLLGDSFFDIMDFIVNLSLFSFIVVVFLIVLLFKLFIAAKIYIGYSGYKIERDKDILHVSRGLFNKHMNSVNLTRICGIQLTQSFLQQKLGLVSVNVIALGYGSEDEFEPTLIPLISLDEFEVLREKLFPQFECKQERAKVSEKAKLAYAIPVVSLSVLVLLLTKLPITLRVLSSMLVVVYGVHQYLKYKHSSLSFNDQLINIQSGGLKNVNSFIELSQVDYLTINQTIFQKRNQISTFKLTYQSRGSNSCKAIGFDQYIIKKLNDMIENQR